MTSKGGPPWARVVLRITKDGSTGETLERLPRAFQVSDKKLLYAKVPDGPRDIVTELYYMIGELPQAS